MLVLGRELPASTKRALTAHPAGRILFGESEVLRFLRTRFGPYQWAVDTVTVSIVPVPPLGCRMESEYRDGDMVVVAAVVYEAPGLADRMACPPAARGRGAGDVT